MTAAAEELTDVEKEVLREEAIRRVAKRLKREGRSSRTHAGDPTWCFRCRRSIEDGDPVRIEVFYHGNDPVEARTHQLPCTTYGSRPKLDASKARTLFIDRGSLKEIHMTDSNEVTEGATGDEPKKAKKSKPKAEKSEKKGKKEKSEKKSKKSKGSDVASAARSAASALREVEGFNTKAVSKTLKAMEAGETPSNADMVALRDHIKAEAGRLREEKKGSAASKLSAVNRHVRRIERSTR